MWLARYKDGDLYLYREKPYWDELLDYMDENNVRLIRVKDCQDGGFIFYYFRYK